MRTAIIYASVHHGNTMKIVKEIANSEQVDLIDATQISEKDLTNYDLIGFASGIYYRKFHQSVLNFALVNLPVGKDVFLICTHGGSAAFQSIETITENKQCTVKGKFSCKGYDTYGPFKLIGGIAKGHPNEKDLSNAVEFYRGLMKWEQGDSSQQLVVGLTELVKEARQKNYRRTIWNSAMFEEAEEKLILKMRRSIVKGKYIVQN